MKNLNCEEKKLIWDYVKAIRDEDITFLKLNKSVNSIKIKHAGNSYSCDSSLWFRENCIADVYEHDGDDVIDSYPNLLELFETNGFREPRILTDYDKPKLSQATDELFKATKLIYGELIPEKEWVPYEYDLTGEYDSKGNYKYYE